MDITWDLFVCPPLFVLLLFGLVRGVREFQRRDLRSISGNEDPSFHCSGTVHVIWYGVPFMKVFFRADELHIETPLEERRLPYADISSVGEVEYCIFWTCLRLRTGSGTEHQDIWLTHPCQEEMRCLLEERVERARQA